MWTKLLMLFLILFISKGRAEESFAFPKNITIIVVPFPPYMGPEGKKGMAISFLEKAFAAAGTKARFLFLPPKRAIKAFYQGEGMLIGSSALVSTGNFKMLRLAMVRAGLYQLQEGAKNKKVVAYLRGVQKARKVILDQGLEPLAVSNYDAGLKMLSTGRVGSFLAQNLPLNYQLAHFNEAKPLKLTLVRKDFYKDAGGLIAAKKHLPILLELKKFISTDEMRELYRKVVIKELAPYFGSFELEDYIWDDFSIIELNNTALELSP